MNEHMAHLAAVQAARDVAADRREADQDEADREVAAAAARTRAVERWVATGAGAPDGSGVPLSDVLARLRDRDSQERERDDGPLVVLGVPGRPAPPGDSVENARARLAARLGRVEAGRYAREALDRRSKWIATAGDAGFRVPGIYDAWIAENHRRAAGQR